MATPRSNDERWTAGKFFLGIGLGLIPMALLFLSVSWTPFCFRYCGAPNQQAFAQSVGNAGLVLYGVAIVATIALLIVRRARPIGYGLLIMVLITPVAAVAGCVVRLPSPVG